MKEAGVQRFRKVGVLLGGPSAEREVSLRSGAAVAAGLRAAGYEVVEVDVAEPQLRLPDGLDAVFVALHGTFGEDGGVQELLARQAMPFTGAGVEASRVSFDKIQSKRIFVEQGIPTPRYEVLRRGQPRTLALPVVVKPARQGSSIGIHRVMNESEWAPSLEDAFHYDHEVLVEEYIEGRELTVGVVVDRVLPVLEIRAPEGNYNYRAKYTSGLTEYLVPAPIPDDVAARARTIAKATFDALGCRGLARIDLRLNARGELFVLELNSIPGFTETSLLPKAARAAGIEFPELCRSIMETAAVE